jgi:opacity protein-like surface antigen
MMRAAAKWWVMMSCLGALARAPAWADDAGGVYLGANFGRARSSYATGLIDSELSSEAASAGDTVSYRARSTQRLSDVWAVDVGYLFTPYLGIEAGFLHLGEIRYQVVGTLTGSAASAALASSTEVTSHGPAVSAVLRLPLTEALAFDLRIGDYFGKATLDNTVTVDSSNSFVALSKTGSSLLTGVGVAYTFAGHWSGRLDYLRVNKTGDADTTRRFSVNVATAGISYTF